MGQTQDIHQVALTILIQSVQVLGNHQHAQMDRNLNQHNLMIIQMINNLSEVKLIKSLQILPPMITIKTLNLTQIQTMKIPNHLQMRAKIANKPKIIVKNGAKSNKSVNTVEQT